MIDESTGSLRWRRERVVMVAAAGLIASVVVGCGLLGGLQELRPDEIVCPEPRPEPEREIDSADATHALLAYHYETRELAAADLKRTLDALPDPGGKPLEQMRQAILLGHTRAPADLPRVRALLDAVLASDDDEALAVRSLARLLADELEQRMRLVRQLERVGAQLKASERVRTDLQQKLDALTEIERSLPARPSPESPPPESEEPNAPQPESKERRNPQ